MGNLINIKSVTLTLVLIGAIGSLIILTLTDKRGVGVTGDGPTYIHMARCLNGIDLCGRNYLAIDIDEWQHFPPLFPVVLAIFHWLGGPDPILGARWINALLFGVNIFLVGLLIYRHTENYWLTIIGSLWMLVKVDILSIHSAAMPEPLFVTLTLFWVLLLMDYFETRNAISLWGCSFMAALACMTRFAGIPLVLTGIVMFLFDKKENISNSFAALAVFFFVSLLPSILWMVKNFVEIGHFVAVDRGVTFHPFVFKGLHCSWPINPSDFPLILLSLILVLILLGWNMWEKRNSSAIEDILTSKMCFISTMAVFIVIYFILWGIVGMLFQNQATTERYFFPIEILGLIFFLSCVHLLFLMTKGPGSLKFYFMFFLLIYLIGMNSVSAAQWLVYRYNDGMEFDGKTWDGSEVIKEVKKTPSNIMIYTNNPSVLYVRGNRKLVQSVGLSSKMNSLSVLRLYHDLYLIKRMKQDLYRKRGLIVYLSSVPDWYKESKDRPSIITIDELKKEIPLKLILKVSDGGIYAWDDRK